MRYRNRSGIRTEEVSEQKRYTLSEGGMIWDQ